MSTLHITRGIMGDNPPSTAGAGALQEHMYHPDVLALRAQVLARFASPPDLMLEQPAKVHPEAWGFAKIPALEELFAEAEAQQYENSQNDHDALRQGDHSTRQECSPVHHEHHHSSAPKSGSGLSSSPRSRKLEKQPHAPHARLLDALGSSRVLHSPHCEVAMAEALGLQGCLEGLSGSLINHPGCEEVVNGFRQAIKKHVNHAWAHEAVKQGVGYAKAGNYDQAHSCYSKALELEPDNVDAFVARGAAFANEKQLDKATQDFRHALELQPDNQNAAKYLEAVERHAQQAGLSCAAGASNAKNQQVAAHAAGLSVAAVNGAAASMAAPSAIAGNDGRPAGQAAAAGNRDQVPGQTVDVGSGHSGSSSSNTSSSSETSSSGAIGGDDVCRALAVLIEAHSKKSKGSKRKRRHKSARSKGKNRDKAGADKSRKEVKSKDKKKKHKHKRRRSSSP